MPSAIPQGRDGRVSTGSGLWIHLSAGEFSNHSCKALPPLEAIKGEPGLMSKIGSATSPNTQHTHTPRLQASPHTE